MRVATELAFLVASVHSKTRVVSQAINSITFRKPVPIGSRLKLIGKVNLKLLIYVNYLDIYLYVFNLLDMLHEW